MLLDNLTLFSLYDLVSLLENILERGLNLIIQI